MHLLIDLGHALRESFFMFWQTLWALVLGFTLAGAAQAFVPRSGLVRLLGGHDPRRIARAAGYGAASSSCSYAAAAMAKALFARGADFVGSMVFMVASTNLVVELGIVLWVLIGWQFALAELVGGLLMIVLFSLIAPRVLDRGSIERARARLAEPSPADAAEPGARLRERLGSAAGWADAARFALADVTMLRKELAVGYLGAGALAVLVPDAVWRAVFVPGHGFWTSLENAAVGPAVAVASFVCSIGNVPLAAALWHGGISFGGVIGFVFADLITLPLLLVYRRYYGGRLTLMLLLLFWAVMSTAALGVEEAFRAASILPTRRPALPAPTTFRLDATFGLDLAAILGAFALWRLACNQTALGGGRRYARDPVCGMQVERAVAPASTRHRGARVFFCSDGCRRRFLADPRRYAGRETGPHEHAHGH